MTERCAKGAVDYVGGLGVKARHWAQAEPAAARDPQARTLTAFDPRQMLERCGSRRG